MAGYWYWPLHPQPPETTITNVRIVRIVRRTPQPVQTPARTLLQTPARAAKKVRSRITPPRLSSHGGRNVFGSVNSPPLKPRTRATPKPLLAGCVRPNANPAVAASPDVLELAAPARAGKISGITAIAVSLDPGGHVVDARIARSSGNDGLDASALQMAQNASYSPKYVACKGVAGTYTFTVRFVAW